MTPFNFNETLTNMSNYGATTHNTIGMYQMPKVNKVRIDRLPKTFLD